MQRGREVERERERGRKKRHYFGSIQGTAWSREPKTVFSRVDCKIIQHFTKNAIEDIFLKELEGMTFIVVVNMINI